MIQIDDTIISLDVIESQFICDSTEEKCTVFVRLYFIYPYHPSSDRGAKSEQPCGVS